MKRPAEAGLPGWAVAVSEAATGAAHGAALLPHGATFLPARAALLAHGTALLATGAPHGAELSVHSRVAAVDRRCRHRRRLDRRRGGLVHGQARTDDTGGGQTEQPLEK